MGEVKMAPTAYKQEMPPEGGFSPIQWWKRVPKPRVSGAAQLGIFTGFTTCAWIWYKYQVGIYWNDKLEIQDARNAVRPFLLAERDRLYLKQLRANRDEEAELMKDVEGWEVGKLYDQPTFHNVRNRLMTPSMNEFVVHMSPRDANDIAKDKQQRRF